MGMAYQVRYVHDTDITMICTVPGMVLFPGLITPVGPGTDLDRKLRASIMQRVFSERLLQTPISR